MPDPIPLTVGDPYSKAQTNELRMLLRQLLSDEPLTNTSYRGIPISYTNFPPGDTNFYGQPLAAQAPYSYNPITQQAVPGSARIFLDTNAMNAARQSISNLYSGQESFMGDIPFRPFWQNPSLWNAHVVEHEYLHPSHPNWSEAKVEDQAMKNAYAEWSALGKDLTPSAQRSFIRRMKLRHYPYKSYEQVR